MGTTKDKKPSLAATQLRRRAKDRLGKKKTDLQMPRSEKDAQRLVQELEIHQIELEMQNAELRRTQEDLELSRNKYVELYDFAPVGYFTFDTQGLILEVNLTGAKLLGIERRGLAHNPFINFIGDADGRKIFLRHCEEVIRKASNQTCEIRLKRKDGSYSLRNSKASQGKISTAKPGIFIPRLSISPSTKRRRQRLSILLHSPSSIPIRLSRSILRERSFTVTLQPPGC